MNRKVSDMYQIIMKELGVVLNLSKSLVSSNGSIEFAKKFFTSRGDCSPISFGEILVSHVNFAVMAN